MRSILGVAGEEPHPEQSQRAPPDSDEQLALRFAERHARELRFVAGWGAWMKWDGQVWRKDETLEAFCLARTVCREAAAVSNKGMSLASARTRAAVVSLAREDRRLAATVDQWDTDPLLLNTPAGMVDLRTGKLRLATPEDYLTKKTAVGPGNDCPLWLSFLDRVTGKDADFVSYLQRLAGYFLTGSTKEHALFFAYGKGANGKSVFINTLAGVLGSYATNSAMETFTATPGDRHPTELAMLQGARLVTAVETDEGARWAESKIKVMTGGDKITARYMRQDFFTYEPQFKLLIAGNHKPRLRSVDEAITRRFHLLPFNVTIPKAERDPELTEKLQAEWPGVLAWAIEGCREWLEKGLSPPACAQEATAAYLAAEDVFGAWLEECCIQEADAWASVRLLYGSYTQWAEASGEGRAVSKRKFSQTLEERGFVRVERDDKGFRGLRLDPDRRNGEKPF
jgi:putative DNA primase/helicase